MPEPVSARNERLARKVLHEQKNKERQNEAALIKAQYLKELENPVVVDVLAKAKAFANYHTRLAQQGMGAKKVGDKVEDYAFEPHERLSHLDKAEGLMELVDYIERQQKMPATAVIVEEKADVAAGDTREAPAAEDPEQA